MKHFYVALPLALAALILFAASPSALAKHTFTGGVVEPPADCQTVQPYPNGNDPCLISEIGVENIVQFQTCSNLPAHVVPAAPPAYTDCLWMYNATAGNLTTFGFTVSLPIGWEPGDTLDCVTLNPYDPSDPTLTPTAGCDQTFQAGDTSFNMTFTTTGASYVKPNVGFFLLMDFDGLLAPDNAGVVVSRDMPVRVPEPGELGLFGLGLLGIGWGYAREKRRQGRGTSDAA
ncbi:MAG: PEP-CTERM sorting domain-containing protein [Rhodanobacter sp.]